MIADLALPEYYLESANIDISPTVGKTVSGVVASSLKLEQPTLTEAPEGFQCEASLTLLLFEDGKAPWQVEDDEKPEKFGTIHADFLIFIPGEPTHLESYVDAWISTGEYQSSEADFRHHLESGVLQYIMDPIGDLLETSYNGIVPRMILTSDKQER